MGHLPEWFDEERDVLLSPGDLHGLVHPIRVQLLESLLHDGPGTATQLGARIGRSSGVTSYHLRVLADRGFVVEDAERGNRRDRWWRAAHRSTSFTFRVPGTRSEPDEIELARRYLQLLGRGYQQRIGDFLETLPADDGELRALPWRMDSWPLRLTADQVRELSEAIVALATRHRRDPDDPRPEPGTVRAVLQFQILPDGTEGE